MTENWIQVVNIKTAKYKLVFIRNPVVVALDWCIYWHFGSILTLYLLKVQMQADVWLKREECEWAKE